MGTGLKAAATLGGTFFGGPVVGKLLGNRVGAAANTWADGGSIGDSLRAMIGIRGTPYFTNGAATPGVNPSYGMRPIDISGQLANREAMIGQ